MRQKYSKTLVYLISSLATLLALIFALTRSG
jgi:hypothetical protein